MKCLIFKFTMAISKFNFQFPTRCIVWMFPHLCHSIFFWQVCNSIVLPFGLHCIAEELLIKDMQAGVLHKIKGRNCGLVLLILHYMLKWWTYIQVVEIKGVQQHSVVVGALGYKLGFCFWYGCPFCFLMLPTGFCGLSVLYKPIEEKKKTLFSTVISIHSPRT